MLLILSSDINLNPGPANRHQIKDHKFEAFTRKGLHFIHLNINSLPPKIDELRYIAKNSNAAVIGISETKLDNTVYDSEVAEIDRVTEIERVEALHVILEAIFVSI